MQENMKRPFSKMDNFLFFFQHSAQHNALDHMHLLRSPHAENLGV